MELRQKLTSLYQRSQQSLKRFTSAFWLSLLCFCLAAAGIIMAHPPKDLWQVQAAAGCTLALAILLRVLTEKHLQPPHTLSAADCTRSSSSCERKQDSAAAPLTQGEGECESNPEARKATSGTLLKWLPLLLLPFLAGCFYFLHTLPAWEYRSLYILGFIGGCLCLTAYTVYPEQKGERLFPQLSIGLVASCGIMLLLNASLSLCLLAFSTLIWHINPQYHLVISAFAFYVVGINIFLSYLPAKNSVLAQSPAFFKVVVRILLPVYLLLLFILYGYVAKIIFFRNLPIGQMNWFASYATCGMVFFYFALKNRQDYRWLPPFLKWGTIALLPILLVQAYGIWIRYQAYGLTTWRYASMLCSSYGLLALYFSFRRKAPHKLYLVAGLMLLVFSLTPLNIIDVPSRQQQNRLLQILEENAMWKDGKIVAGRPLSDADNARLQGSYQYLLHNASKEKYPFIKEVTSSEIMRHYLTSSKTLALTNSNLPTQGLAIDGYSRLYEFTTNSNQLIIKGANGTTLYSYDLTGYAAQLLAQYQQELLQAPNAYLAKKQELVYTPDSTTKIYFIILDIRNKGGTGTITHSKGYIFKK